VVRARRRARAALSAPPQPNNNQMWDIAQLRATLRRYGRAGIVTYLGLSGMVTCGFYVAIERNVDVRGLLGLPKEGEEGGSASGVAGALPPWLQGALAGPGSHLALAVLCSKAMIPIKLPVAVALTPYVARLEARIFGTRRAASSGGGGLAVRDSAKSDPKSK
jgi:hypothetical protein